MQLTVSDRVFAFVDILIGKHQQDRGLARRMQERLLTAHQASPGATLVDRADRPALTALHSCGRLDIGELRRPVGSTTFRLRVFHLGERSTARLECLVRMPGGGGWVGA